MAVLAALVPLLLSGTSAVALAVDGTPAVSAHAITAQSLEERVRAVVADKLEVPLAQVTDTARLREDLGADELGEVDMWLGLEEEFGIVITDEDTDGVTTVQDVINVVRKLVG
jgi:acyl carrier protein